MQEKKAVVVVEYYEAQYGHEERRLFKVFSTMSAFIQYCEKNGISIMDSVHGKLYSDSTYVYNPIQLEMLS